MEKYDRRARSGVHRTDEQNRTTTRMEIRKKKTKEKQTKIVIRRRRKTTRTLRNIRTNENTEKKRETKNTGIIRGRRIHS